MSFLPHQPMSSISEALLRSLRSRRLVFIRECLLSGEHFASSDAFVKVLLVHEVLRPLVELSSLLTVALERLWGKAFPRTHSVEVPRTKPSRERSMEPTASILVRRLSKPQQSVSSLIYLVLRTFCCQTGAFSGRSTSIGVPTNMAHRTPTKCVSLEPYQPLCNPKGFISLAPGPGHHVECAFRPSGRELQGSTEDRVLTASVH